MVPGVAQGALHGLAAPGRAMAQERKAVGGHGRADVAVVAQLIGEVEAQGHLMLPAVQAGKGKAHQGHRHAEQIGVLGQGGGAEHRLQAHAPGWMHKAGGRGGHLLGR